MKLRVWHIPQLPCKSFYVPVESVLEAKKVMDILAAYDLFQLKYNIKPDFSNTSGLEMFNEESGEWVDWYEEIQEDPLDARTYQYFDDVDEYLEGNTEAEIFQAEIFGQLEGGNYE